MGQSSAKFFDPDSPEFECLEQLKEAYWPENDWYELFSFCAPSGVLKQQGATKFFTQLFKHLQLSGNMRQFVASMMARLDVSKKGQLTWNDILLLRNSLRELDSAVSGKAALSVPDNLASRIVKFSDLKANYWNNIELVNWWLDQLQLTQKRQDVGLKEAFMATIETLLALYELDMPNWGPIKDRMSISFVKKSRTTNTSVTSGIAVSALSPGQTVGILNCGTGPLKFQFYKMDETRIVRVLIDFTPPEEQELYITRVQDESKRRGLGVGIALTLKYLLMKQQNVPVVAIVTGELREAWAKAGHAGRQHLDSVVTEFFGALGIKSWTSLVAGEQSSYFLPQHLEGKFEDLACANLIKDVSPTHDVLISCGIGRGTSQWSTRVSTVAHGFGMNAPGQLLGGEISLKNTVLAAFTSEYINQLQKLSSGIECPVIALKSGCLLVLERSPDLMRLLTNASPQPTTAGLGFDKGQTLICNVEDKLRHVQVVEISATGECAVHHNGKPMILPLDTFFIGVPSRGFQRKHFQFSKKDLEFIGELRREFNRQHLYAGYFGLLQDRPRVNTESPYLSEPMLFDGKIVGTVYCLPDPIFAKFKYEDKWKEMIQRDALRYEFNHKPLIAENLIVDDGVSVALSGLRQTVRVNVEIFPCFPIACTLDFDGIMATLEGITKSGEYSWRVEGQKDQLAKHKIKEDVFIWPSSSLSEVAPQFCVVYSYKPGAKLLVCDEKEGWLDATVVSRTGGNVHELQIGSACSSLKLTPENHTWNVFSSKQDFEERFISYQGVLKEKYMFVEDAITGRKLRTDAQLVNLHMKQFAESTTPIVDVKSLVDHLVSTDTSRVVIVAVAGSGKTFTTRQLMLFAQSKQMGVIPILVVVQRLANFIRKSPKKALQLCKKNFVEFYLQQEYQNKAHLKLLLQAMRMRRVLIAVDGIDEAADYRTEIVEWILTQLVQYRNVVTSRPEGLADLESKFQASGYTFLDLKELSPQQQRHAIELQLHDNVYYSNLVAFSNIRTAQDNLYASMDESGRQLIEQIHSFDKIRRAPDMRQRNICGELLQCAQNSPRSKMLRTAPSPELLNKLSLKYDVPKDELWQRIVSATDELFEVAELAETPIKQWLHDLCASRGSNLQFSPKLKDPIRVYEKAELDYKQEFADGVPPTACVMDIVRCRILDQKMAEIVLSLIHECPPGVSVVRLKNKCDPKGLDAAHLRNILMNLMVHVCTECGVFVSGTCCGPVTSHTFEIQVYYEEIFKLSETSNQHHFYEALRSTKEDAMKNQVDFVLNEQMTLFDRVGRVPILLALLVLVLEAEQSLPTSVFDLYRLAIKTAIRKFATRALNTSTDSWEISVYRLLQFVAFKTHKLGVAALTQKELQRAHSDMELWEEICGVGESIKGDNLTFSVVKVISQKEEYRFAHLSFQEFLFLDYQRTAGERPDVPTMFENAWLDNALRIALSSADVTDWLVGDLDLRFDSLNKRQESLLFDLLNMSKTFRTILVQFADEDHKDKFLMELATRSLTLQKVSLAPRVVWLIQHQPKMLDLFGLPITDSTIASLMRRAEWSGLHGIDLGQSLITDSGFAQLIDDLKTNQQLKFIGMSQVGVGIGSVTSFAEMLKINGVLRKWYLSSTTVPLVNIAAVLEGHYKYYIGCWTRFDQESKIAKTVADAGAEQAIVEVRSLTSESSATAPSVKKPRKAFWNDQRINKQATVEEKGAKVQSEALDKQIRDERALAKSTVTVVVWGKPDNILGLWKQLDMYRDLSANNRASYIPSIHSFVLQLAQQLAVAATFFGSPFELSSKVKNMCQQLQDALNLKDAAELIQEFWQEPEVKKAYTRHPSRFPTSVAYFLDQVAQLVRDEYLPSPEDIDHWAAQKTSVQERVAVIEGNKILFVAGGRKLIQRFMDKKCILLIAAAPQDMEEADIVWPPRASIITFASPAWDKENAEKYIPYVPDRWLCHTSGTFSEVFDAVKHVIISRSLARAGLV